jgi:citrate lyase subunit beta / citryl-CoA lyase
LRYSCATRIGCRRYETIFSAVTQLSVCPGNHARRVANALSLDADAVILDLEDAVATAEKPAARGAVAAALSRPRRSLLYVRVNAADTEFCYGDLVAIVGPGLDGIVLPKVESATALATIDWLLAQLEREQDLVPGAIDLIPIIETAGGLTNLDIILAARTRVRHAAFGAGDFTLDVNMAWSRTEAELAFARARIATASRAAGIEAPLDTVWVDLADEERLEMSARTALGFGFQGKMCIHPKQIAPVHRVFTPGDAEVAYAERVVEAFAEAEAVGSAAIQLDGKFIDYPIRYRAQRVLEKIVAIRAKDEQR